MGTSTQLLKAHQLTKRFGGFVAVDHVDIAVAAGQVVGFLGPNGAGKTTTISMMVGLLRPSEGAVTLNGVDAIVDGVLARREVGYLGSDMALDGAMTGEQELEYFGRVRGHYDRKEIDRLAAMLQCDLSTKLRRLSRGNRQKVALIAALMHKPRLLILDEPTSGFDPLIQGVFNDLIRDHTRDGGGVLISSHVLSEVQQVCDQVVFIKSGTIVANTPLKKVLESTTKQVRLTIKGSRVEDFAALTGTRNIVRRGNQLTFGYRGNLGQLLKFVSHQSLSDITISDPDLDEIFAQYYEVEHA